MLQFTSGDGVDTWIRYDRAADLGAPTGFRFSLASSAVSSSSNVAASDKVRLLVCTCQRELRMSDLLR